MEIKPIETQYKGYRFRSRLEARWAVFFDFAKIRWEYEVEGYTLNNGIYYLPDFFLPDFQIYIEIKHMPTQKEIDNGILEEWEDKCARFRTSTGNAILLVFGEPAVDLSGILFAWSKSIDGGGEFANLARFVAIGNDTAIEKVVVLASCTKSDEDIFIKEWDINSNVISLAMMQRYYWQEARIWLAGALHMKFSENAKVGSFNWMRKKARQARFEYGEKG